jgi:poly(A) polymerase
VTFAHLDDVLDEVKPLSHLFDQAGYRLFLVGGAVRDQWLDEPLDASSDIDLTTNALPAEIKRIVAPFADDLWTQGEKFGTIGLRSAGRDFEITTHRAESYSSDSRKPTVSFGDDIGVDLSRRDFTVNAMAIELPDGVLTSHSPMTRCACCVPPGLRPGIRSFLKMN